MPPPSSLQPGSAGVLSSLRGTVALGLACALTWGGGDFAGGVAVKHAGGTLRSALQVVLLGHLLSVLLLAGLALLRHDAFPAEAPLLWAGGAGVLGGSSVLVFYLCLARGAMGPSAALSGLLAAILPALVSGVLEGSPGLLRLLGFLLAAGAIWLIAASPSGQATSRGSMQLAVVAGLGFGLYFVALRMAGAGGVIWPLAWSRVASSLVALAGLAALTFRSTLRVRLTSGFTARATLWALAAMLSDSAGNLFFVAATRVGRLDVASVLASLYPASTILLAAGVLREHPSTRQRWGMALAVMAVLMITA